MTAYSYLALGDSYTIGEQVRLHENFPVQTVYNLRRKGIPVQAPEILAVTGFTTDELMELITQTPLLPGYDLVTLLVGVNNQYRGRPVGNFEDEFQQLLEKACMLAGGRADRVWVLSIPDWGVTPFAADRDRAAIASEIDAYNAACKRSALAAGISYLDITTEQRRRGDQQVYLAADGLHPSGKEYANWATELSAAMVQTLREQS